MKYKSFLAKGITYLLLVFFCGICIFPFLWMISSSLKTESKMYLFPPQWIPDPLLLSNYSDASRQIPLFRYFWNSFYITATVVLFASLVGSMAGYAFAKLRFPGSSLLFLLPLSSMMIPNEVIIVPLFKIWGSLGLINSHVPLILPQIIGSGGMFGVFLLRQFYLSIPTDLCDAAKIDGCSPFRTYLRIFLPLSGSAIATLSIFSFMNSWNNFFDPLIYLNNEKLYTIPLGLALYAGSEKMKWTVMMAASVVATAPLAIVFFIAQRKFMESIALSGIKG